MFVATLSHPDKGDFEVLIEKGKKINEGQCGEIFEVIAINLGGKICGNFALKEEKKLPDDLTSIKTSLEDQVEIHSMLKKYKIPTRRTFYKANDHGLLISLKNTDGRTLLPFNITSPDQHLPLHSDHSAEFIHEFSRFLENIKKATDIHFGHYDCFMIEVGQRGEIEFFVGDFDTCKIQSHMHSKNKAFDEHKLVCNNVLTLCKGVIRLLMYSITDPILFSTLVTDLAPIIHRETNCAVCPNQLLTQRHHLHGRSM